MNGLSQKSIMNLVHFKPQTQFIYNSSNKCMVDFVIRYENIEKACEECIFGQEAEGIYEAEYQGKKVKLNDPIRGGSKKFYVYVKNEKGNVIKVSFGDTTGLSIKRDDPARRKSFRARHNCDNPGPKWKARYWSCYQWRAGAKVNN